MPSKLERFIVTQGRGEGGPVRPRLVETPRLSALQAAGTRHVYGDTADVEELGDLLAVRENGEAGESEIRSEVDGNTANQPLVRKVIERYLDAGRPGRWAEEIAAQLGETPSPRILPLLYAIVCGRIGNDMARAFASGRPWEVSLQLHMGLCQDRERAVWIGGLLREMVPSALVKVPFTPDRPDCFLIARDLEQAGIPVNFTSTFSARQAVTAALLANVARTNIFMGRIDQGLRADRLGEHVDLETQRWIRRLRAEDGVRTQLIIASMREWETFVRVAGCDVFTAPCAVLREFLAQDEAAVGALPSMLEASYAGELGVASEVSDRLGGDRIARLYGVEPELIEFLRELRGHPASPAFADGDALGEAFDAAGFGDLFHVPTRSERAEMERGKLPDLEGELVQRIPLDTHYSLLANADFGAHQRELDREFAKRLDGLEELAS
jgi:transaldolase